MLPLLVSLALATAPVDVPSVTGGTTTDAIAAAALRHLVTLLELSGKKSDLPETHFRVVAANNHEPAVVVELNDTEIARIPRLTDDDALGHIVAVRIFRHLVGSWPDPTVVYDLPVIPLTGDPPTVRRRTVVMGSSKSVPNLDVLPHVLDDSSTSGGAAPQPEQPPAPKTPPPRRKSQSPVTVVATTKPAAADEPLGVQLAIEPRGRTAFKRGDKIEFTVKVVGDAETAYLVVYNIDAHGTARIIFPNDIDSGNRVAVGRTYKLPDETQDFEFEILPDSPIGREVVGAIVSREPVVIDPRSFEDHMTARTLARGISVKRKETTTSAVVVYYIEENP